MFGALDQILDRAQGQSHVDFGRQRLRDFGVCRLNTKPYTNHIQSIILSFNIISDSGLFFMSEGRWQNLQYLQLSNNEFGNKGMKYLTRNDFHSLKDIDLSGNAVDQHGFLHYFKNKWKKLQSFEFRACKSSTDTCKNFAKSNSPFLSELVLYSKFLPLSDLLYVTLLASSSCRIQLNKTHESSKILRVLHSAVNVKLF